MALLSITGNTESSALIDLLRNHFEFFKLAVWSVSVLVTVDFLSLPLRQRYQTSLEWWRIALQYGPATLVVFIQYWIFIKMGEELARNPFPPDVSPQLMSFLCVLSMCLAGAAFSQWIERSIEQKNRSAAPQSSSQRMTEVGPLTETEVSVIPLPSKDDAMRFRIVDPRHVDDSLEAWIWFPEDARSGSPATMIIVGA